MADEGLRVRNWDKWQSYRRDRGQPPWIKVHREVMRNPDWVGLTDAQRGQLVGIWLLAADRDGVIPASAAIVQKLCFMDSRPDLNLFIRLGFLDGDANMASEWRQHDQPEAEKRQRRGRGEERRKIPSESMSSLNLDAVQRIFTHWQTVHGHERAKLDSKRSKLIRAALADYSEQDLLDCITGYKNSPHHMGQNDSRAIYDSIELMLRDAKHIDAGIKFNALPQTAKLSKLTAANVNRTADWQPPELRHGAGHGN